MNQEPIGMIEPLKELKGFEGFVKQLNKGENGKVVGMVEANKAHMIYGLSYYAQKKPIVVTYDEISAKKIYEDLCLFYGDENCYLYPGRDILFYNADVHSMDITAERMRIIEQILNNEAKAVVMSVDALLNPLSHPETWKSYTKELCEGQVLDLDEIIKYLIAVGYERVAKVEGLGQFALRGGILDVFSPTSTMPYRIELWDDEIDSIRLFNSVTQRSIERAPSITIAPNQEVIYPMNLLERAIPSIHEDMKHVAEKLNEKGKKECAHKLKEHIKEITEQIREGINIAGLETYIPYTNIQTETLLNYFSKEYLLFIDDPVKTEDKCKRSYFEYQESMKERLEYGHILPRQIEFIFSDHKITKALTEKQNVFLQSFETTLESYDTKNKLEIRVYENNALYRNLDLLEKDLKQFVQQEHKVIMLLGIKSKAEELIRELEERGISSGYSEKLLTTPRKSQILLSKGALNKGFIYEDLKYAIISDKDLFGRNKRNKRPRKKYQGTRIESFIELTPGDYVVHENHGVGVFKGIEQITVDGISRDNLKIEYADGAMLYIHINQMDMVQKYIGAEGKEPKLSKIGTQEWKKSKAKVKKAVQDIAKDLIKLYSQREKCKGFKYDEDNIWQIEFEQMFPYEETGDQLEAIEEVKKDMESDKVMDRLICGDVGYGKTEVAIRAAFKAVQNSKQVAYLVPTTVLAQQHFRRFEERMAHYPISVGVLSRFRTPKQIKETIEGIRKGTVDVVIGTHRLLSKDVKFRDLGLVIIDEEQRFGVTHKEKLKQIRTEVDVMTLTATPIPRTLHMSLIGIRDMSVLEEAPLERRPVQTYVIEYSEDFIKDAIHRELSRDGQVYFVHNQVKDIEEKALQIQKLVPEARVGFAHGQMSERELEKIMIAFIEKEINVLVCTTIVETGLDISNANTIIINHADRMGLSQLYQLRGRVGRSNKVAYAYLMYQKNKVLKEVAEKRLQAIKQFTQLGAGFKIAMRDLEIRGAGNLLGAQQHGHMESIGYDLYCKMLKQAVSLEKGETLPEEFETSIEMKVSAYIPGDYIPDEIQKLDIYKRIASIQGEQDYYDVQEEIEDRYGNLPQSVQNLMDVAWIKWEAHQLEMTAVIENKKEIAFRFKEGAHLNPEKLPEIIAAYGRKMKCLTGKEVVIKVDASDVTKKEMLGYIKSILQDLKKLKNA